MYDILGAAPGVWSRRCVARCVSAMQSQTPEINKEEKIGDTTLMHAPNTSANPSQSKSPQRLDGSAEFRWWLCWTVDGTQTRPRSLSRDHTPKRTQAKGHVV